ncbi:MAG: hypothetical protein V4582_16240 [Pseudomonadota bacterium]
MASNPWAGVWRGNLGEHKITVCFNQNEYGDYDGNYYYEGQGKPIALKREARQTNWRELAARLGDTGVWSLDKPSGASVAGVWSKPGQKEGLPLRLTRVPIEAKAVGGKGPRECASDAYNNALETAPQLVLGKTRTLDAKRYRTQSVTVPGANGDALRIEGVELQEAGPHIAAINRELLRPLPRSKADLQRSLYLCRRTTLGRSAEDGSEFLGVELVYWSRRYLSVNTVNNEGCGARPVSYSYYRNWDLATGKEVNLWTWFRDSRKPTAQTKNDDYHFNYAASDKLNALILANPARNLRKTDDANCVAPIAANRDYKLRLGKKGMVFSTALTEGRRVCEATFVVPYGALAPWLTKPGDAAVKAILREGTH